MRTPENIVRHELIGLPVKIVNSQNRTHIGMSGRVIDETRNMLTIETAAGKEVAVAKETGVFSFEIGSVWVKVDGRLLAGRPEDRIKKKLRGW